MTDDHKVIAYELNHAKRLLSRLEEKNLAERDMHDQIMRLVIGRKTLYDAINDPAILHAPDCLKSGCADYYHVSQQDFEVRVINFIINLLIASTVNVFEQELFSHWNSYILANNRDEKYLLGTFEAERPVWYATSCNTQHVVSIFYDGTKYIGRTRDQRKPTGMMFVYSTDPSKAFHEFTSWSTRVTKYLSQTENS